jgi:hypothetical protein
MVYGGTAFTTLGMSRQIERRPVRCEITFLARVWPVNHVHNVCQRTDALAPSR